MIDYSMKEGFNYFDTAHGYVSQKSEPALKTCFDYGISKWWRASCLPKEAKKMFDNMNHGSYTICFVASLEGVYKVLSGMSTMEQLEDNISYMKGFQLLSEEEYQAIGKVRDILNDLGGIACMACRYCIDGCPKKIAIPDLLACYNAKVQFNDWNSDYYYGVHTKTNGKASECIGCRQCERICLQHLPIADYLKEVSKIFDKGEK